MSKVNFLPSKLMSFTEKLNENKLLSLLSIIKFLIQNKYLYTQPTHIETFRFKLKVKKEKLFRAQLRPILKFKLKSWTSMYTETMVDVNEIL
jgi:hypothetical protein